MSPMGSKSQDTWRVCERQQYAFEKQRAVCGIGIGGMAGTITASGACRRENQH